MEEQFENLNPKASGFSPREFLLKYLKYLPWFIVSSILFLSLAYIKLRYTPEIYEVRSKMLIKNDNPYGSQDKFQDMFMMNESQNLNDEIEVLKSSGLSKQIVAALNLQVSYVNKGKVKTSTIHPKNAPFRMEILELRDSSRSFGYSVKVLNESTFTLNDSLQPVYFGKIIDNGIAKLQFVKQPVDLRQFSTNEFSVAYQPMDAIATSIAASFRIAPINDFSNVLQIVLETENTMLGRDIVNQLMHEYNVATLEDKRKTSQYTLEFIDERLATLRADLGGVEHNLQRFQESNRAINLQTQSVLSFEQLSDVGNTLTTQEVQLKIVDYLQDYVRDQNNSNKTVPVQLGIEEPTLLALIQQYNTAQLQREANLRTTPAANPLIVELDVTIAKLRQQIIENLANVRQAYVINRNNLLQKSRRAESEISSVPGKTKQMLEITRQQKILEELYSFLLQKKLETSISSVSTLSNSKVIEPARSTSYPVKPNRKGVYMLFLFFGLAIPALIVFLMEFLNDKIRNRSDVERLASAPILGEVGHSDEKDTLVVSKHNRRFLAEQFRIIRTNLTYLLNKVENPVILVTSSFSGEGKSFISTNIGAVIALAGKKTVILEFDIRKPKIIAGLDLTRNAGITNYIVGKANFQELIIKVNQVENLYVIPCGPVPPNPAELLLDEKVAELFVTLKQNFDVIIIDSAPVGLVSDSITLSQYADATMFILRENYTFKKQVKMIDELYANNKLPKVSLLLNDVKTNSGNSYYGGYGYGYGYGYGDGGYFEGEKRKVNFFQKIIRLFFWK